MAEHLLIGEAASILGVSVDTLRRWEKEGKLTPQRTDGGHRRYRRADLKPLVKSPRNLSDPPASVNDAA